jgi:hypothetical protein
MNLIVLDGQVDKEHVHDKENHRLHIIIHVHHVNDDIIKLNMDLLHDDEQPQDMQFIQL